MKYINGVTYTPNIITIHFKGGKIFEIPTTIIEHENDLKMLCEEYDNAQFYFNCAYTK